VRYGVHKVLGSLPAVTLRLTIWPQNLISTFMIADTSVTKIERIKIPFVVFWDMVFTMFSGHCMLWPWPLTFWPENVISTFMNPITSESKIGWHSLLWFLRYGVHKVSGTQRLTQSLTDGQTRMQYASLPPFSTVAEAWKCGQT